MKKTALFTALIAASTLASTAATAKDWSKPSFYGEVEINVVAASQPAGSLFNGKVKKAFETNPLSLYAVRKNDTSVTLVDMQSQGAKFGAKGSGELMDGVEGIYQMGIKYDSVVGGGFKTDTTFLGLKGSFGEVKMGKFNTPMKDAKNGIDLFGNIGSTFSKNDITGNKITQYTTPDLGGVKVKLAYVPYQGDHVAKKDGQPPVSYTTNDGAGISTSVAFEQDGIYVAFAYDNNVNKETKNPGQDVNGMRLVGKLDVEDFTVGAMYDRTSMKARTDNAKAATQSNIVLSASMNMDKLTPHVAVAIGSTEVEDTKGKTSQMSLVAGADYAFNDGATAYANIGRNSYEIDSETDGVDKLDGAQLALEVGLEYKF